MDAVKFDGYFSHGQILKIDKHDRLSQGTLVKVVDHYRSDVPFVTTEINKETFSLRADTSAVISKYRIYPYLILPTLEEAKAMNIEDLSEEQLNEISITIAEALDNPDKSQEVDTLDLQLAVWDCIEQYGIPHQDIGALITIHGERLIGEVMAKQLIGIL